MSKTQGTAEKARQEQQQFYGLSQLMPSVTQSLTKGVAPEVAVATTEALKNGADPISLAMAKQQLGDKDFIGYCESFVENVTGEGWKGSSATDAWNNQLDHAVMGLNGVQPGDPVYFADPNNPNGHTGVYAGNNQFISATDNGIEQNDLGQWQQSTGQQVLGYIPQEGQ